jgi:hypothetical protein
MFPSGSEVMSVSRLPAGTTIMLWLATGSAEPQIVQKLRVWRVPGSRYVATEARPVSQVSVALEENRLAA